MKKIILTILVAFVLFSVFSDAKSWFIKQTDLELGSFVEYNPVGQDLTLVEARTNPGSYKYGLNFTGGMRFLFIENRILCDVLKPNLVHFSDRGSINIAIPFPYVTPFFGIGIKLTMGQNYVGGPFYFGYDDTNFKNLKFMKDNDIIWNTSKSVFFNVGTKIYLPNNINITIEHSILNDDFEYNMSSWKDLPIVMKFGQIAWSVSYKFL